MCVFFNSPLHYMITTTSNFSLQHKEFKLLNPEKLLKRTKILNTINIFQQSQEFSNQMKKRDEELKLTEKKIKIEKKITLLFRRKSSKDVKSFEIIPLTAQRKNSTGPKIGKSTLFEFPRLLMNGINSAGSKKKFSFMQSPANTLNYNKSPKENFVVSDEIKEKIKKKILNGTNTTFLIIDNSFSPKPNNPRELSIDKHTKINEPIPNKKKEEGIVKIEKRLEKKLISRKLENHNELINRIAEDKKSYLQRKNFSFHMRNKSLDSKVKNSKNNEGILILSQELELRPWKIESLHEDDNIN